jgi:hypothetical protein
MAANAGGVPPIATMTVTWLRIKSAASTDRRSYRPSAHRYSITTLCPSMYPAPLSPLRNASTKGLYPAGVVLPRTPTTGTPDCSASVPKGQAAVPPRSVMKSRRRIASPLRPRQPIISGRMPSRKASQGTTPASRLCSTESHSVGPICRANVSDLPVYPLITRDITPSLAKPADARSREPVASPKPRPTQSTE